MKNTTDRNLFRFTGDKRRRRVSGQRTAALGIGVLALLGPLSIGPSRSWVQAPVHLFGDELEVAPTPAAHRLMINAHNAGDTYSTAETAAHAGADMVEIDVSQTSGHLVAAHSVRVEGWLHDPRDLQRVWSDVNRHAILLDVKTTSPSALDHLVAFTRTHRARQLWFSTPNLDALQYLAKRVPGSTTLLSITDHHDLAELLDDPTPSGVDGVSINQRLLTRSVTATLRQRGLLVQAYSVDDMERVNQLAGWGVTGVTTDNVTIMQALGTHPTRGSLTLEE